MKIQNLWAPWRLAYLEGLKDDHAAAARGLKDTGQPPQNFLAEYWTHPHNDPVNFVVHRDEVGFILLNRYPYSNGHLLIALGDARPRLLDYAPDQRAALWRLVDLAVALVEETLNPQGVNIGINQGRAAGAGVPEHLHAHAVPRWGGDTNFMTAVGEIRVASASLESMYERYRAALPRVLGDFSSSSD